MMSSPVMAVPDAASTVPTLPGTQFALATVVAVSRPCGCLVPVPLKKAAFSFLAQGHFKDFVAVYKAIFTVARTYKQFQAKRSTLPKLAFQDCYPESVVKLHYLKRMKIFNGKTFEKH